MKPMRSRGATCEHCGQPVAYLHFDARIIPVEADAMACGSGILVERHYCRVPAETAAPSDRPERSGQETTPVSGRARGRPSGATPFPVVRDWCVEQLRNGPMALVELRRRAAERGITRATLYYALKRLEAVRTEVDGRAFFRLAGEAAPRPVAVAEPRPDRKDVILGALAECYPAGLTLTHLRRKTFAGNIRLDELRKHLTELRSLGVVRSHAAEAEGRYRSVWTLTEKPAEVVRS